MHDAAVDAPVLIAGGGLVGLSAAMFLGQHGVGSIVVERLERLSPMPRAARSAPWLRVSPALAPLAPDFDSEVGYVYQSSGVLTEPGGPVGHADPRSTRGAPGTRLPHVPRTPSGTTWFRSMTVWPRPWASASRAPCSFGRMGSWRGGPWN